MGESEKIRGLIRISEEDGAIQTFLDLREIAIMEARIDESKEGDISYDVIIILKSGFKYEASFTEGIFNTLIGLLQAVHAEDNIHGIIRRRDSLSGSSRQLS